MPPGAAQGGVAGVTSKARHGFDPQVYERLARVLSQNGRTTDATEILIDQEKQRREIRRRDIKESSGSRFECIVILVSDFVFRKIMGYGYKPIRLFWFAVCIIMVGTILFMLGDYCKLIIPTEKGFGRLANHEKPIKAHCKSARNGNLYNTNDFRENYLPKYYPQFNPLIYSVDVFSPIGKLNQQEYWQPNDLGCDEVPSGLKLNYIWYIHVLRWWSWVESGLGWLCVTCGVAGLNNLLRKPRS
jgi:hypothetical protein